MKLSKEMRKSLQPLAVEDVFEGGKRCAKIRKTQLHASQIVSHPVMENKQSIDHQNTVES